MISRRLTQDQQELALVIQTLMLAQLPDQIKELSDRAQLLKARVDVDLDTRKIIDDA